MAVTLFQLLYDSRDGYLSGQKLAEVLGVSRTAVWKEIERLKAAGAVIESGTNKGYRLKDCSGLFDASYLKTLLEGSRFSTNPLLLDSINSTNTYLRERGFSDLPEYTVTVARTQSGGRGRMGRRFHSPESGLYYSLLLRPGLPLADIQLITLASAVALCETLREDYGAEHAGIKWVNDVFIGRKKICGILTEGNIDAETGTLHFAVVGMGINLRSMDGFPEELRNIATSLEDEGIEEADRLLLCSRIIHRFEKLYALILSGGKAELLARYRNLLFMLSERVRVMDPSGAYDAVAESIDDEGALLVRDDQGILHTLKSGEISLKIL